MDISDILNSIRPRQRDATDPFSFAFNTSASPPQQVLLDLTRAYTSERLAPDLRPYPTDLLQIVNRLIRARIEEIEEAEAAGPEPNGGNSNTAGNNGGGSSGGLKSVILQTDLERWKWLVRALLRVRLQKLSKFARYYLADQTNLGPSERAFVETHQGLLHRHYTASFLGSFPENLRGLDDAFGGVSMVDKPDLDKAVFIRVLPRGDGVVFNSGVKSTMTLTQSSESQNQDERGDQRWREGDIWVVRYGRVLDMIDGNQVELI
jgi:GINS complex subunit 4